MQDVGYSLSLDARAFTDGLRLAEASALAFSGSVERAFSRLGSLGPGAAGLTAVSALFVSSAKEAVNFEQQTKNLNTALRANAQELQNVSRVSLDQARQTQFNATGIFQAQYQLARAGNMPQAVIQETRPVLDLASATRNDPTTAANSFVTASSTFQRGAKDAVDTANVLAQAADSSVDGLSGISGALKQAGAVAASAGEDFRSTAAAIASLQNEGLRGNDAGTALKVFMQRIEAPSAAARQEIEALGLSFYTTGGQLKTYSQIADEVRLKTLNLTDEQKNQALTTIFGARGVRAADIFAEQGSQGLTDTAAHMASIGSASDIAAEKLNTVEGSLSKLSSSLNLLEVQGGTAFLPAIRGAADFATMMANMGSSLGSTNPAIPQVLTGAVAVGAELGGTRLVGRYIQGRQEDVARTRNAPMQAYRDSMATAQTGLNRSRTQADQTYTRGLSGIDLAEQQALVRNGSQLNSRLNTSPVQASEQQRTGTIANLERQKTLEEEIAKTELQMNAQGATRGYVDPTLEARLAGRKEELDLVQQQNLAEANLVRIRTDAAAAGASAHEAMMQELQQEQAVAEARLRAATVRGDGALAGDLTQQLGTNAATQNFLRTGGTTAEVQAQRLDMAYYAQKQAEQDAQIAAAQEAGLTNIRPKPVPTAQLSQYRGGALADESRTVVDELRTTNETIETQVTAENERHLQVVRENAIEEANGEAAVIREATQIKRDALLQSRSDTLAAADASFAADAGLAAGRLDTARGGASRGTAATLGDGTAVRLVATEESMSAAEGMTAKRGIASALGGLMAAGGEIMLAAMIVMTVKELIVDPTVKAAVDDIAKGKNPDFSSYDYSQMTPAQQEDYVRQQQAAVDKNKPQSWWQTAIGTSLVPETYRLITGHGFNSYVEQAAIDAQHDQAAGNVAGAHVETQQQQAWTDSAPDRYRQANTGYLQGLLGQVSGGKLSASEARTELDTQANLTSGPGEGFFPRGIISDDERAQWVADGKRQIDQAYDELVAQKEADEDKAQQNATRSNLLSFLGVSQEQINSDINGGGAIQGAKQQDDTIISNYNKGLAQTKTELTDIERYTTTLQSSVGQIDISKGFSGLSSAMPQLQAAQVTLASMGQHSDALDSITALSKQFNDLGQQIDLASAAWRGYLAQIAGIQGSENELNQFLKGESAAYDNALRARDQGIATPGQLTLIQQHPATIGKANVQLSGLQGQEADAYVNAGANIFDYSGATAKENNLLTANGGPGQVALNITVAQQSIAATSTQVRDGLIREQYNINVNPHVDLTQIQRDIQTFVPPGMTIPVVLVPGSSQAALPLAVPTVNGSQASAGITQRASGTPGGVRESGLAIVGDAKGGGITPYTEVVDWENKRVYSHEQATAMGLFDKGGIPKYADGTSPDWNKYNPLSYQEYLQIVRDGSGNKESPFANLSSYYSLMHAAQTHGQNGVDPRVLLAWTKSENNNATNISPSLINAHNYGGIQFAGQDGAHDAGFAEPGYSRDYAAFENDDYFWNALAANVTEAPYDNFYQQGGRSGLESVASTYAKRPGSRVDDYYSYASNFPTDASNEGGAGIPQSAVASTSGSSGSSGTSGTANAGPLTKAQSLLDTARKYIGGYTDAYGSALDGQCEKFVDDVVQEVTGTSFRGANAANPVAHLNAAQQGVSGAGRVLKPGEQPQAGDIVVILPGTEGASDVGHTGIYQNPTTMIATGPGGVGPQAIPQGAQFIRPDGVEALPQGSQGASYPGPTQQPFDPTAIGKTVTAAVVATLPQYAPLSDAQKANLGGFGSAMAGLDHNTSTDLSKDYDTLATVQAHMAINALGPNAGPYAKSKATADAYGNAAGIFAPIATAVASGGDLTQPLAALSASGPAGPLMAAQVQADSEIAKYRKDSLDSTQKLTDLEAVHSQVVQQRADNEAKISKSQSDQQRQWQMDDRNTAHTQQTQERWSQDQQQSYQRSFEDATYNIQQSRQTVTRGREDSDFSKAATRLGQDRQYEDDTLAIQQKRTDADRTDIRQQNDLTARQTTEDRRNQAANNGFQDQSMTLSREGTLAKRQLEDESIALDKLQQKYTASNNAQALSYQVGARAGDFTSAQRLAALKDSQLVGTDQLKDRRTDLADKTRVEQRTEADAAYNLQLEQTAEQRRHQQAVNDLADEGTKDKLATQARQMQQQDEDVARTKQHTQEMRDRQDVDVAEQRSVQLQQRQWQDEDTQRQRSMTLSQRSWQDLDQYMSRYYQDIAYNNETSRLQTQQGWADDKAKRDQDARDQDAAYTTERTYWSDRKTFDDTQAATLTGQRQTLDGILAQWQKVYDIVGPAANTLLTALPAIAAFSDPNAAALARGTSITSQATTIVQGHARGGTMGQYAVVGENPDGTLNRTSELVSMPGAHVYTANELTNFLEAIGNASAPATSGGGGGNTYSFSFTGSFGLSDEEKQGIMDGIPDLIAKVTGRSVASVSASRGGKRR